MRFVVSLLILTAALLVLLTAGTPDASKLASRLDSDSAAERDAAARRLAELGESARGTLETVARDGSPEARRRSRALLGLLESENTLAPRLRRHEARALFQAALRQEGRLATDTTHDARLAELGAAAAEEIGDYAERRLSETWLSEADALAAARHPSRRGVAALAAALRRDRIAGSAVVRAARLLGASSGDWLSDRARDDLCSVLAATGDPRRRAAAALLLACDASCAESLAADTDARVRIEAARALGRLGGGGAAMLERLGQDTDADVRAAALDALRHVPGAPRPEAAHANADHAEPRLRAAAATLLASDAVPESIPVLRRLATDESARVRAAAERSLAAIGSR